MIVDTSAQSDTEQLLLVEMLSCVCEVSERIRLPQRLGTRRSGKNDLIAACQ